jgi:hypothetical protein
VSDQLAAAAAAQRLLLDVTRTAGPNGVLEWEGEEVPTGWAGDLAVPKGASVKGTILQRWGGGDYQISWTDQDGRPQSTLIRLPGEPKPLRVVKEDGGGADSAWAPQGGVPGYVGGGQFPSGFAGQQPYGPYYPSPFPGGAQAPYPGGASGCYPAGLYPGLGVPPYGRDPFRHAPQDHRGGDRRGLAHVARAGQIENRLAQLGGPADRLIHRIQAGNPPQKDLAPFRHSDRTEHHGPEQEDQ